MISPVSAQVSNTSQLKFLLLPSQGSIHESHFLGTLFAHLSPYGWALPQSKRKYFALLFFSAHFFFGGKL